MRIVFARRAVQHSNIFPYTKAVVMSVLGQPGPFFIGTEDMMCR